MNDIDNTLKHLSENKHFLTRDEVRKEIENYIIEKEKIDTWNNPQGLADVGNFQPRYPVMEAWISSISEDFKTAELNIPYHLGETNETLTAIMSAELVAWCTAWKQPAEYYSTILESPFWGKLSVNGNDFQTSTPTIQLSNCVVAGSAASVPPVPVTGSANPVPPLTKVDAAVYKFTGNYDKNGSTIQTDKDKFLQQPIVSGLWPFNALKKDWRKDKPFIQKGDKVAVIFLNGDPNKAFVTQIIAFSENEE